MLPIVRDGSSDRVQMTMPVIGLVSMLPFYSQKYMKMDFSGEVDGGECQREYA